MALKGIGGNGATLTLSGFTMGIRVIDGQEETKDPINASYLGDASELYISGDTTERGQLEFEAVFDPTLDMPALSTTAVTATVTYKKMIAASGAAGNVAGTGLVTMRKYPNIQNKQLCIVRGRIKWDGDTDPVFTKEV